MFHSHDEEWQWLEDFQRKYKRTPGREAFKAKFPDFVIRKTSDTEHFCDEVRQSHVKHMLTEVLSDVAESISDGDIDTAVRTMTSRLVTVQASIGTLGDEDIFSSYQDILLDVRERKERADANGSAGVPSALDVINERLGGYNPGELIIWAARLGEGKSWVIQNEASMAAANGYAVVFDALEQTRAQVGMRIHALLSSTYGKQIFQNTSLMQGKGFDLAAYEAFLAKMKKHIKGRLHVSDASRGLVSPFTVAAQIETHKPDIVFIDYLTLMKRSEADWQGIAKLSGELKGLAATYQIPIVAAAQLNRSDGAGKGDPPDAEALAGSDAIGQDADVLVTQRQKSRSVIKMKMAKNRNGPGGFMWWVQFQPGKGLIKSISYDAAEALMEADADEDDKNSIRERG